MAKTADNVHVVDDEGWNTVVEPYAPSFEFSEEATTLIGTFLATRQVEQEGLDGNPRLANIYEVQDNSGTKWSVWGTFSLDKAFEEISVGSAVKIVWEGKVEIKGGKTVNQFTVMSKRA